jgi:transposase
VHDWEMQPREQLGLVIAAVSKITQKGPVWLVPSQSGGKRYTVCADSTNPHCTCPDHETTGNKCKHIHAVEYVIRREENPDGTTTVIETLTVTKTIRKTYPQDWTAYNAAQTNEKDEFQTLLFDLCSGLESPPQTKGRPRIPLSDAIFATTFKVYSTLSGRRFMSDLRDAHERGYISKVPHFNSISNYLENPLLTSVLRNLITVSSLPLKAIETEFAVDSTGFTASRFVRWHDLKYGRGGRREHDWVKAHLICGVKTHIVSSVEIHERDAADSPFLPSLLATTAEHFTVREVSADKAYGSVKNHKAIAGHGATAFIPFKSSHTGAKGGLWKKAYHYFHLHREEFLAHYHKRSNVETTMHMIKSKFRDHVRSKTETAMMNEVLCKVLAHNICCLIQSVYELGVDPGFLVEERAA